MMTVREAIKYLETLNPSAVLIMSKDSEGNLFSPWSGDHSEGLYVPETTWYGDFMSPEQLENSDNEYTDDDKDWWQEKGVPAVVLWPIN